MTDETIRMAKCVVCRRWNCEIDSSATSILSLDSDAVHTHTWDFTKCHNQRRIQYFSILFKQKMFVFVCTINRCESHVHGTIITIISDNDMQVWTWIWGCWRRRMVRLATPDTRNMPTHTIRPLLKAKTTTCSADDRRAFGGRRRCCFRRTHISAWTQLKKGYRQTLRIHSFFGTHSPDCRTTDFQSMGYDCIGAIRWWSSSCDDNNTHRQTHMRAYWMFRLRRLPAAQNKKHWENDEINKASSPFTSAS